MHRLIPIFVLIFFSSCRNSQVGRYPVGQIQTPEGEILFALSSKTPNHKASFIRFAEARYWDSLTFNRVIPNFVIQGGCPDTKEGFSSSPYLLDPEFHDSLRHVYGAVGAGRDDNPKMLSAGCQFYIVQNRKGLPRLDKKYTVFGKVFKGMEVVDSIASLKRDSTDTPILPVPLKIRVIYLNKHELKGKGYSFGREF